MDKKLSPFDFLNAINFTKDIKIIDEHEKEYNSFMINRGLSYFTDTVLIANQMNQYPAIESKQQFYFLLTMSSKKKRFSKWAKLEKDDNIEIIKEYYGYSNQQAKRVITLLSNDEIKKIKDELYKGGR